MKKSKFLLPILLLTALFTLNWSLPPDGNWEDKIDPELILKAQRGSEVECIVLMKEQADVSASKKLHTKSQKGRYVFETLRTTAQKTQQNVLRYLFIRQIPHRSLYIVNAVYVQANIETLQALASLPEVHFIQGNPTGVVEKTIEERPEKTTVNERGLNGIEWGISMINADDVWALGYNGQGVVVGGQDTGYEWDHPALRFKYRGWDAESGTVSHDYNWHDAIHVINPLNGDSTLSPENNPCGVDSPVPCDDHNHGTHTMGTMVGEIGDNRIGVAPGARWIACRNMERGYGSPFTYLESFQWFLAPTDLHDEQPDPDKAPHVINNSWYCPEEEGCNPANFAVLRNAITNLKLAGVVVVISAGNSGSGCGSVNNPPALFDNSFSIGATRQNDTIAAFSSRGPVMVDGSMRLKPDVSAPGVGVRSSIRFGGYASFSGTSMAGPHVAGLVALMISANPELAGQVETIEGIIKQTAAPKTGEQDCGSIDGDNVPNNTYGYGRVDALAAVEAALDLIVINDAAEDVMTGFKVFPNPFDGQLKLEWPALKGTFSIHLVDITGRQVFSKQIASSSATLSLQQLPAGVYFYKIHTSAGELNGKVIKQR
jgi:subtilisin family serine protease